MVRKSFKWYAGGFWLPHIHLNRTYRDHLFRFLFKDKRDLLELYNALNGSDYRDPNALEIVYPGGCDFPEDEERPVLHHRGSSESLRAPEHEESQHASAGISLLRPPVRGPGGGGESGVCMETRWFPFPHPSMWYSTMERRSWRTRLPCISPTPFRKGGAADVWSGRCMLLNINRGHNRGLLEKCRRLEEYSEFVSRIYDALSKGMSFKACHRDSHGQLHRGGDPQRCADPAEDGGNAYAVDRV